MRSPFASVRPRPDGQGRCTISEVATFTELRAHTLRRYEQIGLMRQVGRGFLTGSFSDAGKELSGGDFRQVMHRVAPAFSSRRLRLRVPGGQVAGERYADMSLTSVARES